MSADLVLLTLSVAALQPVLGSVAAFAAGGTLCLFKYSRAEDAKVSRPPAQRLRTLRVAATCDAHDLTVAARR